MIVSNDIIAADLALISNSDLDWGRFNGKTVLITGANGFLPAYMVETLLYLNKTHTDFKVTVLALVRNLEKAKKRFSDYCTDDCLVFIEQDVSNPITIRRDIHFIVHAASQASPKYYGIDPVGTLNANIIGTVNLMKLAIEKKIESFLYFSSGEIYGQVSADQILIPENGYGYLDPLQVRSCYAESKRMGENICISYHHQYGIPATIVRPFHTYGPKMMLDDGRVFADFVRNILAGQDIILKSDGSMRRAFCYLSDAIVGFFTVLLSGISGEAYNIGNPQQEYSVLELANILQSMYESAGIKVVQNIQGISSNQYLKTIVNRSVPDVSKMKKLGWEPQIPVQQGFRRTIESFQMLNQ